jgi:hypothetical protein
VAAIARAGIFGFADEQTARSRLGQRLCTDVTAGACDACAALGVLVT